MSIGKSRISLPKFFHWKTFLSRFVFNFITFLRQKGTVYQRTNAIFIIKIKESRGGGVVHYSSKILFAGKRKVG